MRDGPFLTLGGHRLGGEDDGPLLGHMEWVQGVGGQRVEKTRGKEGSVKGSDLKPVTDRRPGQLGGRVLMRWDAGES